VELELLDRDILLLMALESVAVARVEQVGLLAVELA
jgi:hypothetical protein